MDSAYFKQLRDTKPTLQQSFVLLQIQYKNTNRNNRVSLPSAGKMIRIRCTSDHDKAFSVSEYSPM